MHVESLRDAEEPEAKGRRGGGGGGAVPFLSSREASARRHVHSSVRLVY